MFYKKHPLTFSLQAEQTPGAALRNAYNFILVTGSYICLDSI